MDNRFVFLEQEAAENGCRGDPGPGCAVAVPVNPAGRIATGEPAEQVIATGQADLIGLARVLWADPEWPRKVAAGRVPAPAQGQDEGRESALNRGGGSARSAAPAVRV